MATDYGPHNEDKTMSEIETHGEIGPADGPPTTEELKSLLAGHLIEAHRLAGEIAADASNPFGISLGPEVPDLHSARGEQKVAAAARALAASERELGTARMVAALIEAIADSLMLTL